MFYIANKVLTYPCKTVIEDVLSREGIPGEDAFSLLVGSTILSVSYCVIITKTLLILQCRI